MTNNNKSAWEQWKENLGESRPWDLLNSENYTSQENAKKRLNICGSCSEFVKVTSQCRKCGCIMSLKTKLEKAECPIGKW